MLKLDLAASHDKDLQVLCLGAHCDDIEIGCGGTVARLVEQGYRVGIVDLTDGEPTPTSAGPEVRRAESLHAAKTLGVKVRVTLDLPNRRLFDTFEARVALAKELRKYRPRLVLGLGDRTPMAAPDHYQAMLITEAAVFYAKLTKWDDHFTGLPPHVIPAQLYMTLTGPPLGLPEGRGALLVDISDTLERKLASVRCYATQFPPEKQHIFARIEAAALCLGQSSGVAAAELLVSPRMLPTRNLMQAIFGA